MHDQPPQPYTATIVAELIGGPLCGARVHVSPDAAEYGREGVPGTYLYDVHASERLGLPLRFLHDSATPWLYTK